MHTIAARTERDLLPAAVAKLLERNDQCRADRARAWRQHTPQTRARETAYQRIAATRQQAAQRDRIHGLNRGYGIEL
jgi:hypothetical protein